MRLIPLPTRCIQVPLRCIGIYDLCNDPVSVLGFVPGFMDGLFMNECGPGLMGMLFD